MTPEERAEKFYLDFSGETFSDNLTTKEWIVKHIAAEIRDALKEGVQEASQECGKCRRAHAVYCAECFEGEKRAAVEEDQKYALDVSGFVEKAKAEGKRFAYEDAAEIADDHNGCVDVKCLSESNCGATIANQIRALKETL